MSKGSETVKCQVCAGNDREPSVTVTNYVKGRRKSSLAGSRSLRILCLHNSCSHPVTRSNRSCRPLALKSYKILKSKLLTTSYRAREQGSPNWMAGPHPVRLLFCWNTARPTDLRIVYGCFSATKVDLMSGARNSMAPRA